MAQAARRAVDEKSSYSGRLLLRMPPELHAEVARKAELERVSLNQFITTAVADAVGGPNGDSPELAGPRPLASSRTIKVALLVNLVVVTLAGIAAVTLLVLAWRGTL